MSELTDIAKMREALKGNAPFKKLSEERKAELFQGMSKVREWLDSDLAAERFSNREALKRDKESLLGPLKRILQILRADREISIDLIDGLLRNQQAELGKIDAAAAVAEMDAFKRTAQSLLTIVERAAPSRLITILVDRDGRPKIADPPDELSERASPRAGIPIVRGYKPGMSQRKKMELELVNELIAEFFGDVSEAEANKLAAAMTLYTRADGRRNGRPVTPGAIKKQKQRRRRKVTGTNVLRDSR